MPTSPEQPPPRKRRRAWRYILLSFTLLLAIFSLAIWRLTIPPFTDDPTFRRTTRSTSSLPAGMSLRSQIFWKFHELKRRHFPNPFAYTFPARDPVSCSVHGLLNQCMEVSGTEYLIEKHLAAGSVLFGHTNTMNSQEWVQSFEHALQTARPEWWDYKVRGFRKENLVLLRYNRRTVLVLTPETAERYQAQFPRLQRISPQ